MKDLYLGEWLVKGLLALAAHVEGGGELVGPHGGPAQSCTLPPAQGYLLYVIEQVCT